MNYIVLDFEWNQSTDQRNRHMADIPFEIIEIGAVKLNENKEKIDEFSELIKPQVYQRLHYITKKLIHLKMTELENSRFFQDVISDFFAWCGEEYIFCTWGSLDLIELQRNMRYYGMEPLTEEPLKYLDIQKLFSLCFEDHKSRRSLEYAIDYLYIEKDIPFHRAFSDAYYTAKVLAKIQDKSIEQYVSFDLFHTPADEEHEVHIVFETYEKYISREFLDKQDAIADREVISTTCYKCNKPAKKKTRWFSINQKHYYCVSYCKEHGYLKGKIRLRKAENGNVYIVKTLKLISEEEAEKIREKQRKIKIQKRDGQRSRN